MGDMKAGSLDSDQGEIIFGGAERGMFRRTFASKLNVPLRKEYERERLGSNSRGMN